MLSDLSIDAPNRQELQPYNTIAKIVNCFAVEDAEMKRYALASIINMTNNEESALAIRQCAGALGIVLANLRDGNPKSRRASVQLLRSLLPPNSQLATMGIGTDQFGSRVECIKYHGCPPMQATRVTS